MNVAIVKAGGVGARMGAGMPKQFIPVEGKPVVVYTLEAFQCHPEIDEIIVVCLEGWIDLLRAYVEEYGLTKVRSIVAGGSTSLRSIRNGVREAMSRFERNDIVMIHDANRPMVTEEIITNVLAEAKVYESAVAAIPCTDETMYSEGEERGSTTFVDHKKVWRIQTPDAYRLGFAFDLLEDASDLQLDTIGATNVLCVIKGGSVHFARGSEVNIRLTTSEDISLFKSLLVLDARKDC